jgi:transcription antitermination factor NusG
MNTCASTDISAPWIALVVRPRAERRVQSGLSYLGLETFVPWHGVRRRWSDRVTVQEQNLFPGYVFCRSAFAERHLVLSQTGVQSVVSFDRKPASIPDTEIRSLRRAIESHMPVGPWPFLTAGQRVRIDKGLLAGLEGTLARDASAWRVVVSVNALCRSIAVEVDRDMLAPLSLREMEHDVYQT